MSRFVVSKSLELKLFSMKLTLRIGSFIKRQFTGDSFRDRCKSANVGPMLCSMSRLESTTLETRSGKTIGPLNVTGLQWLSGYLLES